MLQRYFPKLAKIDFLGNLEFPAMENLSVEEISQNLENPTAQTL
jgi:hypothetical protein